MASKRVEVLTAGAADPAGGLDGTPPGEGCAGAEQALAQVLADLLHVGSVPRDANFFTELGADSMVMARFCARVRKRPDLPTPSIRDIYRHPTISGLADALTGAAPAPAGAPADAPARASTAQYVLCGALQLLFFLGYVWMAALIGAWAYRWISAGSGVVDTYLRAVLFGGAGFVALCILPIAAKWVLIGRWKPRRIRVWSLGYVRFWLVKTLVRANPLAFVAAGSALYGLYLRALGAKIGPGTVILSRHVPVCTDLLTIGPGTIIRKDAFFQCYRAHEGWIEPGTVRIGRDAFIGEKSVLDVGTSVGDGAQLGHTSALYTGQAVPDGERWHGSPAQPAGVDYLRVAPARCGPLRRARYCVVSLLWVFFCYLPLLEGGLYLLLNTVPSVHARLAPGGTALTSARLYLDALVISTVLFGALVLGGLLIVLTVPRVLNRFLTPGAVYPLYGFHDRLHRAITRLTSIKFFTHLFGDSSYITHYLRWLGYDLSDVEQTGSNFGTEVAHETPYLSTVGSGTMVADGLSLMNADFSSTSFKVSRVAIGPRNFVGNNIAYPAGGRTGENCLLATKAMIPLDGPVREGVGLLGSPPFEIPRSVERDSRFDHLRSAAELRGRLHAKNWHNLRTIAVFLASRWLYTFLLTTAVLAAFDAFSGFGELQTAAFFALTTLITAVFFVLAERALLAFRRLRPRYCSIYDPYFWRHERLWKVPGEVYLHAFDGTPFKNLIWRGLGVRIGQRVFDDGCYLTERTLTTLGDDCVLNTGTKIQCHSQEDGTFKSDRTSIGAGCTLGVNAMVHYGVTMGDGAVLEPDSFLMKGEEVPPRAAWGGNPARELR